jgi:hypothetical protein
MSGKAGGPNLTRRIINVGVSGTFTSIYATGPTRAWSIRESILTAAAAANTPVGFQVKIPNDGSAAGFTTIFGRPAASETNEPGDFPSFENWNRISEHGPHGEVFGSAAQTDPGGGALGAPGSGIGTQPATLLAEVCSLTAAATSIEIVEYF